MRFRLLALTGLASCVVCSAASAQTDAVSVRSDDGSTAPARAVVTPAPAATTAPAATRLQARPTAVPADSVADDVQRIVVLCATDADSDELQTQWSAYIEKHEVAEEDLDELIATVIRRAEALRAERADGSAARRVATDSENTRKRLHDTAMAVIRKIG
jgi:hypothetical protein